MTHERTYIVFKTDDTISRRDRQLVAETHRCASRLALRLQAPIVALYTGSVLEGEWPADQTLAVVPDGIQSVVARPAAAADRSCTLHTAISIGWMIIVRLHRCVKIVVNPSLASESGRGNCVRPYTRDR